MNEYLKYNINENNLSKIPLLSREEEKELFLKYKTDNEDMKRIIRDKIFIHNLRLVSSSASNFKRDALEFEDMYIEGCLGLLVAIDRFDVNRGVKFASYASYWISHYITRACQYQSHNIRIPVYFRKKYNIYFKFTTKFFEKNLRYPTFNEIIDSCDLTIEEIKIINRYLNEQLSLNNTLDDSNSTFLDYVVDYDSDVEEIVDDKCLKEVFDRVFDQLNLSERDKEMIKLRFGFHGDYIPTYKEIGEQFNICGERVRKRLETILKKIRTNEECRNLLDGYIPRKK